MSDDDFVKEYQGFVFSIIIGVVTGVLLCFLIYFWEFLP